MGEIEENVKFFNIDICVCCGSIVPEGTMVCPVCRHRLTENKPNPPDKS